MADGHESFSRDWMGWCVGVHSVKVFMQESPFL